MATRYKRLTSEQVDRLLELEYGPEMDRTEVEHFEIPDEFDLIFDDAFSGMTSLREIEIPEGILYIGRSAFTRCVSLRSVRLPSTLEQIDDFAFSECFQLREIELPEGLEEIGANAFQNDISLKRLDIPGSVKEIGDEAFRDCVRVRKLTLHEGTEYLGYACFGGMRKLWRWKRDWFPSTLRNGSYFYRAFKKSTCRIRLIIEKNFYLFGRKGILISLHLFSLRNFIHKLQRYFGVEDDPTKQMYYVSDRHEARHSIESVRGAVG